MKKSFIVAGLVLGSLTLAAPALAQNLDSNGLLNAAAGAGGAGYSVNSGSLASIIGQFIRIILGLLSTLFFLYTLYAGWLWMSAMGNDKQVIEAKGILTRATVGLAIMLTAYAIASSVVGYLSGASVGAVPGPG